MRARTIRTWFLPALTACLGLGCSLMEMFDERPVDEGEPCRPGEERTVRNACGVCDTGILSEECGPDGVWRAAAEDPCNDPEDGDDDGFATSECAPGVSLDCNDDDPEVHPATWDCEASTSEVCATPCGTDGERTCSATCEWSACEPPPEACGNGVDDDCDGETDELEPEQCRPGAAVECTTTCATTGSGICLDTCNPPGAEACTPPAEACNGIDDDCDGLDDDGFPCIQGRIVPCSTACSSIGTGTCTTGCEVPTGVSCAPPEEVCNGRDDDCDTAADEGFECVMDSVVSCTTICDSEGTGTCTASCVPPLATDCTPLGEACANGVDDDCDTETDELDPGQCWPGTPTTCTTTCGTTGTGECQESCRPPGPGACTPPDETCNGVDDDCDLRTDNGFACVRGATVPCTTGCGTIGSGTCTDACQTPTGGACTPPADVCNGVDDDCDGVADGPFACALGETVPCTTTCGSTGSGLCSATCEIPVGAACTPPAEICANGADDDCDGETDELAPGQCLPGTVTPCTTTCGSTGTGLCQASCLPPGPADCTPPAEACNGLDDDCDLRTDNGFACARGALIPCATGCGTIGSGTCTDACEVPAGGDCTPPLDTCNGVDDDCDGSTDASFACALGTTVSCATACGSTGSGMCTPSCEIPVGAACTAPVESCNGADDDCDGSTDETFACIQGAAVSCTTSCGSTGAGTCTAACAIPAAGACTPPTESCSGVDDDCDTLADEGFTCRAGSTVPCLATCGTTGSGVCTATCGIPGPAACTPPGESCNAVDDDCDGSTDETYACVLGTTVACTAVCGTDGSGICTGSCAIPTGSSCTPPAELCNAVDEDCDGSTDEDFDCARGSTVPCTTTCGSTGSGTCTTACTVPAPASCAPPVEDCVNGVDDDCDGTTDEIPPGGCTPGSSVPCTTICGSTTVGPCTAACVPPSGAACPIAPDTDCDMEDDDCDGPSDEHYVSVTTCGDGACERDSVCVSGAIGCTPGGPTGDDSDCDGLDDDCDGSTDEHYGGYFCGVGECRNGSTCVAGEEGCVPHTPGDDDDCDGADDDCDGSTDEHYVPTTCGDGACERLGTCIGGTASCTPGSPTGDDSDCDAVDDDCDGGTDEHYSGYVCGIGGCERFATCASGAEFCVPGTPDPSETCGNGVDDDCDTTTDEGC